VSPTMIVVIVAMSLCILGAWPRRLTGEPPSGRGRLAAVSGAIVILASLLFPWFEYREADNGDLAGSGSMQFLQAPNPWIIAAVVAGLIAAATLWAASDHRLAPAGLVGALAWALLGLVSIVFQSDHGTEHVDANFRVGIGVMVTGLAIVSIGAGYLGISRMSRSVDLARAAHRR